MIFGCKNTDGNVCLKSLLRIYPGGAGRRGAAKSGRDRLHSPVKRRETTAVPSVNLDSSVSGTAGGWENWVEEWICGDDRHTNSAVYYYT